MRPRLGLDELATGVNTAGRRAQWSTFLVYFTSLLGHAAQR
jgi:hypothetical protein